MPLRDDVIFALGLKDLNIFGGGSDQSPAEKGEGKVEISQEATAPLEVTVVRLKQRMSWQEQTASVMSFICLRNLCPKWCRSFPLKRKVLCVLRGGEAK